MRVAISGSPMASRRSVLRSLTASSELAPDVGGRRRRGFETIEDRVAAGAELHALIDVGRKPLPQQDVPPSGLFAAGEQHDEAGQVGDSLPRP